jgi:transcriptional regulator with XRE-family HTH domain
MLPEALRLIRVFHDVKQNELAERFGVSKSYISEIESGKKNPSIELIEKYAAEFRLPSSSILFFSEQLSNKESKTTVAYRARVAIASKVLNFLQLVETRTSDYVEKNS